MIIFYLSLLLVLQSIYIPEGHMMQKVTLKYPNYSSCPNNEQTSPSPCSSPQPSAGQKFDFENEVKSDFPERTVKWSAIDVGRNEQTASEYFEKKIGDFHKKAKSGLSKKKQNIPQLSLKTFSQIELNVEVPQQQIMKERKFPVIQIPQLPNIVKINL